MSQFQKILDEPECTSTEHVINPDDDSASSIESKENMNSSMDMTVLNTAENDQLFTQDDIDEGAWLQVLFPCDISKYTSSKE